MDLAQLKSEYSVFAEQYKLPEFSALNEAFEIDRIERDTDYLLREVRKILMDKVVGYIRFIEMMIHPAQAPPMFLLFVKHVTDAERKLMERVYQRFVELELTSLKLEIMYSGDEEAAAIKRIYKVWNESTEDLQNLIGVMEKNWHSDGEKTEKGYFG